MAKERNIAALPQALQAAIREHEVASREQMAAANAPPGTYTQAQLMQIALREMNAGNKVQTMFGSQAQMNDFFRRIQAEETAEQQRAQQEARPRWPFNPHHAPAPAPAAPAPAPAFPPPPAARQPAPPAVQPPQRYQIPPVQQPTAREANAAVSEATHAARTAAAKMFPAATPEVLKNLRNRVLSAASEIRPFYGPDAVWDGMGPNIQDTADAQEAMRRYHDAVNAFASAEGRSTITLDQLKELSNRGQIGPEVLEELPRLERERAQGSTLERLIREQDYEADAAWRNSDEGRRALAEETLLENARRLAGVSGPTTGPTDSSNGPFFAQNPGEGLTGLPTSGSASFEGSPSWWGGDKGILNKLINQAAYDYNRPYPRYEGQRVAPQSKLHFLAEQKGKEMLVDPHYRKLMDTARENVYDAGSREIWPQVQNYLQESGDSISPHIAEYVNPHEQEVIDRFARNENERFLEDVLPKINNNFISRGAYNSGHRQKFVEKALKQHEDSLLDSIASLRHKGFTEATGLAERQKGRQLAVGQHASNVMSDDSERKFNAARLAGDLAAADQNSQRQNLDFLQQMGAFNQKMAQTRLNQQYQDWLDAKNHPYQQTSRLAEIVRGLPVSNRLHIGSASQGVEVPAPSPYTQSAGLLANLYGNYMGSRQQHASGGRITANTITDQMGDGMPEYIDSLQRLRSHADELDSPGTNPMWSWLANLGAGVASSKNSNPFSAIGESVPLAHQGYQEHQERNLRRKERGLAIREKLAESLMLQEERQYRRNALEEEFAFKKKSHEDTIGVQRAGLGLKEKYYNDKLDAMRSMSTGISKEQQKADQEALKAANERLLSLTKQREILAKQEVLGKDNPEALGSWTSNLQPNSKDYASTALMKSLIKDNFISPGKVTTQQEAAKNAYALALAANPESDAMLAAEYATNPTPNMTPEAYKYAQTSKKSLVNHDYVDVLADLAYQKVFGTQKGKEILKPVVFEKLNLINENGDLDPNTAIKLEEFFTNIREGKPLTDIDMKEEESLPDTRSIILQSYSPADIKRSINKTKKLKNG